MALYLNDLTSNANNLTNVNAATEVSTSLPFLQSSTAVNFASASSQTLTAVDSISLSPSSTWTVEFWVKFSSLPSNATQYTLICKGNEETVYNLTVRIQIYNDAGTYQLGGAVSDNTVTNLARSNYITSWTPSTGVWYHVAVTCDISLSAAATFEFFVDGVSAGNGTNQLSGAVTAIRDNTEIFRIGSGQDNSGGTRFADAKMDDVRFWNDVRTATEISSNKNVRLVGNEANLVGYWPLEQFPASFFGFFSFL